MDQLDISIYSHRDEIEQDIDNVQHDLEHIQLQLQTYTFSESTYETHDEFDRWKARATFSLSEKAREIKRLERVLKRFDIEHAPIMEVVAASSGNKPGFFDTFFLKPKV